MLKYMFLGEESNSGFLRFENCEGFTFHEFHVDRWGRGSIETSGANNHSYTYYNPLLYVLPCLGGLLFVGLHGEEYRGFVITRKASAPESRFLAELCGRAIHNSITPWNMDYIQPIVSRI